MANLTKNPRKGFQEQDLEKIEQQRGKSLKVQKTGGAGGRILLKTQPVILHKAEIVNRVGPQTKQGGNSGTHTIRPELHPRGDAAIRKRFRKSKEKKKTTNGLNGPGLGAKKRGQLANGNGKSRVKLNWNS